MHESNYLGIDWGQAKLGLALAHGETRVAMAYAILPQSPALLATLSTLLQQEAIGTVVIGCPTHRDMAVGEQATRAFGQSLARATGVRVVFGNEMFTTRLAQQLLLQRGEKRVNQSDDAEAAKIMLQDWLDAEARQTGRPVP